MDGFFECELLLGGGRGGGGGVLLGVGDGVLLEDGHGDGNGKGGGSWRDGSVLRGGERRGFAL